MHPVHEESSPSHTPHLSFSRGVEKQRVFALTAVAGPEPVFQKHRLLAVANSKALHLESALHRALHASTPPSWLESQFCGVPSDSPEARLPPPQPRLATVLYLFGESVGARMCVNVWQRFPDPFHNLDQSQRHCIRACVIVIYLPDDIFLFIIASDSAWV